MNADTPAFPTLRHQPFGDGRLAEGGLTKREMFAAMAMQGIHASGHATAIAEEKLPELFALVASFAVQQADALLAELAKEKP